MLLELITLNVVDYVIVHVPAVHLYDCCLVVFLWGFRLVLYLWWLLLLLSLCLLCWSLSLSSFGEGPANVPHCCWCCGVLLFYDVVVLVLVLHLCCSCVCGCCVHCIVSSLCCCVVYIVGLFTGMLSLLSSIVILVINMVATCHPAPLVLGVMV